MTWQIAVNLIFSVAVLIISLSAALIAINVWRKKD